jgi:hypothetical protein
MALPLAPSGRAAVARPAARRAQAAAAPRPRTVTVAAAKGISLHIGINEVDPQAYRCAHL